MSKILMQQDDQEEAKQISIRIFAMPQELKISFLEVYIAYIREVFIIKFLNWRRRKLIYQGKTSEFDWNQQLPQLLRQAK
jgi:hypothetical protein